MAEGYLRNSDAAHHETNDRCTICLEEYKIPRCLPNCSHSFCELCLATYVYLKTGPVRTKGKRRKSNNRVKCPLCRTPILSPKCRDDISEWIHTVPELNSRTDRDRQLKQFQTGQPMNPDFDLKENEVDSQETRSVFHADGDKNTHRSMMETGETKYTCEPCHCNDIKSEAMVYCKSCNESQCERCSNVHKSSKATRDHKTVDIKTHIENILKHTKGKNPTGATNIHCPKHREKVVEFYCISHKCFLCSLCLIRTKIHRDCEDIVELYLVEDQVAKSSVPSQLFNEVQSVIACGKESIAKLETAEKMSREQVNILKSQFDDIRKKVNEIVDKCEKQVFTEVGMKLRLQSNSVDNAINGASISLQELMVLEKRLDALIRRKDNKLELFDLMDSILNKNKEFVERKGDLDKVASSVCTFKLQNSQNLECLNVLIKEERVQMPTCPSIKSSEKDLTAIVQKLPNERDQEQDCIDYQEPTVKCTDAKIRDRSTKVETPNTSISQTADTKSENRPHLTGKLKLNAKRILDCVAQSDQGMQGLEKKVDIVKQVKNTESVSDSENETDSESENIISITHTRNSDENMLNFKVTTAEVKPNSLKNPVRLEKRFKSDIETPDGRQPWIGDLVSLPDGRMMISDYKNCRLIVTSECLEYVTELNMKYPPGSLALLDERCVLACLMKINRLAVLSVGNEITFVRYVTTSYHPKCVVAIDSTTVLVSMLDALQNWHVAEMTLQENQTFVQSKQILRHIYEGFKLTVLPKEAGVSDYNVLQCCEATDMVYCFNRSGTTMFKCEMQDPKCVLCDKSGTIVVVDFKGEFHFFKQDGSLMFRTLNQRLHRAKHLAFDMAHGRLYVAKYKDISVTVLNIVRSKTTTCTVESKV